MRFDSSFVSQLGENKLQHPCSSQTDYHFTTTTDESKGQRRTEPQTGSNLQDQIACDCQATCIGKTGRNLNLRLTEHKRATRNGDINNHIAEHHLQTNHRIDWDSAKCITYSTNYYQRLTLESFLQLPAPFKRLIDNVKETDKQ